jgi:hypothetical protein
LKRIYLGKIFILLMAFGVLTFSCKTSPPLELKIDYPIDGSTLRTNLIKVIGEVSNPEAIVKINGSAVPLSNDTFSEFLQLEEGSNQITIAANIKKQVIEKTINVTFVPVVAVFLSTPQVISNPIIMDGYVFPPLGSVKVNDNPVVVDEYGKFSSQIQLSKGSNVIRATAEYAGSEDNDTITIPVQNGIAEFPLGKGLANLDRLEFDNFVSIKAGQSMVLNITHDIRKGVRAPTEYLYGFTPVANEYGEEELPLPAGMNISLVPAKIKVYPNTKYPLELSIQTEQDTPTGDYWIKLYRSNDGGIKLTNRWIKITVTDSTGSSEVYSASIPIQTPAYFPVQKEPAEIIHPLLMQGELVLDSNGYLRVGGESGGLIIWPYGYSWKIEGKEIWIIDDRGQSVARVGDWVKMGGSGIPKYWAEGQIGSPLQEGAEGPYWLAGGPVEKY